MESEDNDRLPPVPPVTSSPATPSRLPASAGMGQSGELGPAPDEPPGAAEQATGRGSEGAPWGLDNVWRWRLLTVRHAARWCDNGHTMPCLIAVCRNRRVEVVTADRWLAALRESI